MISSVSVVASVCYVATWELIYYKLAPDFSAKQRAYAIEQAESKGASQADLDEKIADTNKFMESYQNPSTRAGERNAVNAAVRQVVRDRLR